MRKKIIKVPIYFGDLVMLQTNKFEKVNKSYNSNFTKDDNKIYDAVVFKDSKKHINQYVVVFRKNPDYTVIAHETVHLVNAIFKDHGIELDLDNDEPQAYLTGWIFNKIDKFLNKK